MKERRQRKEGRKEGMEEGTHEQSRGREEGRKEGWMEGRNGRKLRKKHGKECEKGQKGIYVYINIYIYKRRNIYTYI